MKQLINRVAGGSLLIAGTAIGAGMLALPLSIGASGFYHSLLLFFLSCLLMVATAFLLMEMYLWFEGEINITTAARQTLGPIGEIIGSLTFLWLLLAINSAYINGASELAGDLLPAAFEDMPKAVTGGIFTLIFAAFIYFGTSTVDIINRLMMVGLVASYVTLVTLSIPQIDTALYSQGNIKYLAYGWPIMIASFAYQFVIPTLKTYLDGNAKALGWSIIIGTTIPLIFFLLWVGVILGVLPYEGLDGIAALIDTEREVSGLSDELELKVGNPLIPTAVRFFSMFALITSLLGASISLCDYYADLLQQLKPKLNNRLLVTALTFIPCYLFTVLYPNGFMLAIRYAAISIAILLGILPVCMVGSGRYYKNLAKPDSFRVPGGKVTLVIVLLLSLSVIVVELLLDLGMIARPLGSLVL